MPMIMNTSARFMAMAVLCIYKRFRIACFCHYHTKWVHNLLLDSSTVYNKLWFRQIWKSE